MEIDNVVQWMLNKILEEDCIYQDDVVDYLTKEKQENLLTENSDGNIVIGSKVLSAFRKQTENTVVWVKSDRYWRHRCDEDEPGREAIG